MEMLTKKTTLNGERVLEKGGKLKVGVKSNHYGMLKQTHRHAVITATNLLPSLIWWPPTL